MTSNVFYRWPDTPGELLHEIYFTCLSGKLPADNVWKRGTPLKNTEGDWTNGNFSYWCLWRRWREQCWWRNSRSTWFWNRAVWFDWLWRDITSSFVLLAVCREALTSDRNPQSWSAALQFSGRQWIKKKIFTNQAKWNGRTHPREF